MQADIKNNKIEIVCNQHSEEYNYCGGKLSFIANSSEVKDEAGKFYTINELDELCKSYWNKWKEQTENG